MKKLILSLLLSFIATYGFSQISVGGKIGINYGHYLKLVDTESFNARPDISPHLGMMAEFAFNEKFALRTEVLLSPKSTLTTDFFSGIELKSAVELTFVTLPILIKRNFKNIGLSIGVEPGYRVLQRILADGTATKIDIISFGNKFDLGLLGGIDYRLKNLNFGLRYSRGLSNIFQITQTDENGQILPSEKNFSRLFQVSLGYFFK